VSAPWHLSLTRLVVLAIEKRGQATIDDLQQEFPDVSRKKLHAALCSGRDSKRLRVKVRGNAQRGDASIWEVGTHIPPEKRLKTLPQRRISSVWDLGQPAAVPWPLEGVGRRFNLLGGWDDQV
jgi:hypothetical protein